MPTSHRVPLAFAQHQRAVLRGMGELALAGMIPGPLRGAAPVVPGEWIERIVPPPPAALIDAYAENVGASPGAYADTVPAHLFPHWAFAMSGELMRGLRYPLLRAVNGGCRLDVRGELPRDRELVVRGRLAAIDDDGRRAIITQRFTTGVAGATQLQSAEVRVFVPLAGGAKKKRADRDDAASLADHARQRAARDDASSRAARDDASSRAARDGAREIGAFEVGARAGWEFALLTGDFNPIHWARPWARASGFRSVILHGFGTFARAWEVVRRDRGGALGELDARFTKPLALPARARVLRDADRVWVVDDRDLTVMEARLVR